MTDEEKKERNLTKHLDKLVMGAIIGGAVFSVIGARRAAKKRREEQEKLPFEAERAPSPKRRGIIRRLFGF